MMFNQYPYLNLNDLNLDYILAQIKTMMNEVTNFVSINAIKYADPIQWDITRQYEKNTVIIDPVTGTAYISVAPVPAGVALTRPEYWTVVFDLGSFVTRAAQNFTSRYEQETTLTATFPTNTGEWLVWGDVLYKAKTNITAGDTYVVDGNIEHFTIEDLYNTYLNTIAQVLTLVGDLADLTTSDTSSIVNAINSVVSDYTAADTALDNKIGDLDDLTTTDKTSVVNAINEIDGNLAQEVIDRTNADDVLESLILGKIAIDATNPPAGYTAMIADDQTIDNGALLEVLINQFPFVYIPNGTYYVRTPINIINANRCIISDGATLKIADDIATSMNMFVVIANDANKNLHHISLHNLVLDGNRIGRGIANNLSGNTLFLCFTSSAYDIDNIELDRVEFINSAGFAALFAGHANGADLTQYFTRNIWIHNSLVHDNYGYIGTSGVEGALVELCYLYDNDCENLCFDNNSRNCTLRNSKIGTSNGGIGSVGIGICINAVIESNDFDYHNNTANTANYRNCITCKTTSNPAMNITIMNNVFKRATNAAIYLDYDSSSPHSISAIISNNVFNGCTKTIVNTCPADKGIIKCDLMLGQSTTPDNSGGGNVIYPPLFAVWRAVADSFVVSGDTFINFSSHMIYHKLGVKNTYGIPAILLRGYYRLHCDVSFRADAATRVSLRCLVGGNVVAESSKTMTDGFNELQIDELVLASASSSVQFFLINFDSNTNLAFELGRASIEYVGDLESNLTDFATY